MRRAQDALLALAFHQRLRPGGHIAVTHGAYLFARAGVGGNGFFAHDAGGGSAGECHAEFGPFCEDVLLRIESLVPEALLAGGIVENLRRDHANVVRRPGVAVLPHVDEHDVKPAGMLLRQFREDGRHHFTRNAFVGAEIDEARPSGSRSGGSGGVGGAAGASHEQGEQEEANNRIFHKEIRC